MPSGKLIAWIIGLSALTFVGLQRYQTSRS